MMERVVRVIDRDAQQEKGIMSVRRWEEGDWEG